MGRLELGKSTYNGKWANGKWFNSWGVDFNYFIGNLQTRGEWLESYRQMPIGQTPTIARDGTCKPATSIPSTLIRGGKAE
jgi:hypothetical protein